MAKISTTFPEVQTDFREPRSCCCTNTSSRLKRYQDRTLGWDQEATAHGEWSDTGINKGKPILKQSKGAVPDKTHLRAGVWAGNPYCSRKDIILSWKAALFRLHDTLVLLQPQTYFTVLGQHVLCDHLLSFLFQFIKIHKAFDHFHTLVSIQSTQ